MIKSNVNIYNFFDRAIPSFIKKADLIYRSGPDTNHFVMSPASLNSPLVNDQSTDLFLMFIKSYFKYLEQTTYGHDVIKNWLSYRDIDQRTLTELLPLFKKEYIPSIPTLINKSLNVPIKLDIKSYAEDYYQHLCSLSAQKKYDRFKTIVSDYEIRAYIDNIKSRELSENRLLYVFVDYNPVDSKSRIIAAAHVFINPLKKTYAEISISVEPQYSNQNLEEQLLKGIFIDITPYLSMIDKVYVNHTIYMMNLSYGKVINANNKLQLIENDFRAINFNLNQNDQSYELMFKVDTSNTYQVSFQFDTLTEVIINYQYLEHDPNGYYTSETISEIDVKLLDGGNSKPQDLKVDGGTSSSVFAELVTGGLSIIDSLVQVIPSVKKLTIPQNNIYKHQIDIHQELWAIDDFNPKGNDSVEIRFYKNVPQEYKDYGFVSITDQEVTIEQLNILDVYENTILIVGYENILSHFENIKILSVIFNVPYRFVKLKITILNNYAIPLPQTKSKAVSVFTSEEIKTNTIVSSSPIEYQVDTTGYFIENSQYDQLPNNYDLDYGFLIKHIKDFYLKKGTELSYKFLFKLLFNANTTINYPKNNMLIASDMNYVKQHISYFRQEFSHDFSTEDDQILYLLTSDYQVISYGQLLTAFKHTVTVPMEFPQVRISRLFFDDVDSLLIFIDYDSRYEPYFGADYINVIIRGCQPSYYNGCYQATITRLSDEILFRIPLKIHPEKIFEIKNIPPNIKDNKKPGEIIIDNRKHLPETHWGMVAMLEYQTLTDQIETFAVVDQNDDTMVFPMVIESQHIIDNTLFTSSEGFLPIYVLNSLQETLCVAELLEWSVKIDHDKFTNKTYDLLLKTSGNVSLLKDMRFVKIVIGDNELIDAVKPCVMNSKTLSVDKDTPVQKQYRYQNDDPIIVYDNHAIEHSAATIISINEINKNINTVSFLDHIIPVHSFRTYYYDTQYAIDKSFKRMPFHISLNVVRIPVTNIISLGDNTYEITATFDGSGETDCALFFNNEHEPENSIKLHGFIDQTLTVTTPIDLMSYLAYDHLFIQYDECLVDEQGQSCEGWSSVYFDDTKLYQDLTKITFDDILVPYYNQYSNAFKSYDDFYTSLVTTPEILQPIILNEKLRYYQYFKEKQATGYVGGQTLTIDMFMFKTEHFIASNLQLPLPVSNPIGLSSSSSGYFISGYHDSEYVYSGYSTKINFVLETIQDLSYQLLEKKESSGSVNGFEKGYYAGGKIDTDVSSRINRMTYTTDTNEVISVMLSTGRSQLSGCYNSSEGFFVGGLSDSISTEISQLEFSSETLKETSLALAVKRTQHNINQFEHKAYISGGQTSRSYDDSIVLFNMLSFNMINMQSTLPTPARNSVAVSSLTSGYVIGGEYLHPLRSVVKLEFTTENISTIAATLINQKSHATGVQNTSKTSSGLYRVNDMNTTSDHPVNQFDDVFFLEYFYDHIFSYIILKDNKFPMIIDEYLVNRLEIEVIDSEQFIIDEHLEVIVDSSNTPLTYYSPIKTNIDTIKYNNITYSVTNDYIEALRINYLKFLVGYHSVNLLQNQYNKTTCLNKSHLQDNFYYQPYSYEIINEVPLEKYKNIINNTVHPVGLQMFAQTIFTGNQIEEIGHEILATVEQVPAITPTIWPTRTPTPTPSTTVTMSRTASNTPTPTTTSTVSRSPTPTGTPTQTATRTPTPTTTKTLSPTPSSTVTLSSTTTLTSTPTPTTTKTLTPTASVTASSTQSLSPTPTPTKTLTASPTTTLSATPTTTLTASMTPSPSMSHSLTPSSSRSSTPPITPSKTSTTTKTLTPTPTPSRSYIF